MRENYFGLSNQFCSTYFPNIWKIFSRTFFSNIQNIQNQATWFLHEGYLCFINLSLFHTFGTLAEYIYKHFQLWCSELITWRVGQNLFKLWQQISFTCVQLLQILLLRQLLTRGDRWKCWKLLPERGRAVSVLRRSKFWETFGWPRIWGPSTIKETKFLIIQRQMRTPSNRQCFFFSFNDK